MESSRVVDHLQDKHPPGSGTFVTYLYCDYQRTGDFSSVELVGAILRQFATQLSSLPDKVAEMVRRSRTRLRKPNATVDEMNLVLKELAPQMKRLFVCIDALDECKDAERLVEACRKLTVTPSLLFLGRQSITSTVKRSFPDVDIQTVEPQRGDIHAVISEQIEREGVREPELMSDDLADQIREEISAMANGM